MENDLQHYGVSGMRWGKRRTPAQLAAKQEKKADKKWEKNIRKSMPETLNRASQKTLPQQDRIAKSLAKKHAPGSKDFNNEYTKKIIPIMNKHISKDPAAISPSRKKKVEMEIVQFQDVLLSTPKVVDNK